MFQINIASGVPIYEQLYKKIVELVLKDVLKENDQLPSVRSLAKDLGVNPNTVQKAYQELERDGLIYSVAGKGNFIAGMERNSVNKKALEEFKKAVEEALSLGFSEEELIKMIKEWSND